MLMEVWVLFFFLTWKNKDKLALGQGEEIRGIRFHCMTGRDHSWTLITLSLSLEVCQGIGFICSLIIWVKSYDMKSLNSKLHGTDGYG